MDLTGIYKIIFYFFYLEAIGVGFFVKHWKSLDYLWGFRVLGGLSLYGLMIWIK